LVCIFDGTDFFREYIIHNGISKEWKGTTFIRVNWKKCGEKTS